MMNIHRKPVVMMTVIVVCETEARIPSVKKFTVLGNENLSYVSLLKGIGCTILYIKKNKIKKLYA
jgi:hypothetical protein